ncbi:secreted protein [Streptomyces azureus]|uniref:Secreted protein n=2 Tax=Streptomyces azureus TaxID=146537 RepID=A0A0K8PXV2_STRAJ|nr:secreted protein [Streptomyces azureus]
MPFRRPSRTSVVMTGLVALAALTAGGCDSGPDRKPAAADGPAVIAPGEPGEANRTLSAQEAADQHSENDSPNSADVSYARMMIAHHAQALVMTELAPERVESAKVKRIAARIAAAQKPEIEAMKGWLKSHGKPLKAERHEHATMPGMATEAQLDELRAADGKAFDQLFLTLMTTHHQGAITMATDVKGQGNNIQIEEMADEVIAQQTSEISRMRDML